MKIIRSWRHRPVKKALLIGILYHELDPAFHLRGTANDVEKLRDILIGDSPVSLILWTQGLTPSERFGYRFEDIVVMTDRESAPSALKPTKTNIVGFFHNDLSRVLKPPLSCIRSDTLLRTHKLAIISCSTVCFVISTMLVLTLGNSRRSL
jgi:hypothetical protein